MAAHVSLHALRHGHGDRHFRAQRASSDRSAARQEKRIRPHAQIQYRRQAGRIRDKIVPEQSRLDALRGNSFRLVLLFDRYLRHPQRKLRHRPVPVALRLGLPLHRGDVPRPNLLRASAFRSQRPGDAPRHIRRAGLLILLNRTDAQVGSLSLFAFAMSPSRLHCTEGGRSVEYLPIKNGDVGLHAVAAGPEDGPVVVLLHGFPEFWYSWHRQIEPLSAAVFASSSRTSAAITSAANPSASLRMPCLSSFPTSSPSPITKD